MFENDTIECETLCGWLIPNKDVPEFESLFNSDSDDVHNFDDFFVSINFNVSHNGQITINIDDSPNNV